MTSAVILTVVALVGTLTFLLFGFHCLRQKRITKKGIFVLVLCGLAVAASVWYFAPRSLEGFNASIVQQKVQWHGVGNALPQSECVQPEKLPMPIEIRRYHLGDVPAPGSPVGMRAVSIEMTLDNGSNLTLMLCPDRPSSSRIWLYDTTYNGSVWFLTKESAERCVNTFIP